MRLRECTDRSAERQVARAPWLDWRERAPVPCRCSRAHHTGSLHRPPSVEADTLPRATRFVVPLLCFAAACGTWKRVGAPDTPTSPQQLPRVFDPTAVFRQMGLIADNGPLAVVGGLRLLAGPTSDSTLVLVALSLHNRGFAFQRDGNGFAADYRVELVFRLGTDIAQQVVRDERIRVPSFRETMRTEETVIFQQAVPLRPGDYQVTVTVRDRNGPNLARSEIRMTVPGLLVPAVSHLVMVYRAQPRTSAAAPPALVVNPRSAVGFGTDSLRFYFETYGLQAGAVLAMDAVDPANHIVWEDTLRVDSTWALRGWVVAVPPNALSLGLHHLHVSLVGGSEVASAPFLVAFSDFWAVTNFDDMVNLLRYFPEADTLRHLGNATSEQKAAAWRKFWHDSDPNPLTPENEALDQYFTRVRVANARFSDEGTPGWLTDRGEVLINIGEPDQVYDANPGILSHGHQIRWDYNQYQLELYFIDDAGFGRFRLDPSSRNAYLTVLNRLRRSK